jgi:hypothetical protein
MSSPKNFSGILFFNPCFKLLFRPSGCCYFIAGFSYKKSLIKLWNDNLRRPQNLFQAFSVLPVKNDPMEHLLQALGVIYVFKDK